MPPSSGHCSHNEGSRHLCRVVIIRPPSSGHCSHNEGSRHLCRVVIIRPPSSGHCRHLQNSCHLDMVIAIRAAVTRTFLSSSGYPLSGYFRRNQSSRHPEKADRSNSHVCTWASGIYIPCKIFAINIPPTIFVNFRLIELFTQKYKSISCHRTSWYSGIYEVSSKTNATDLLNGLS